MFTSGGDADSIREDIVAEQKEFLGTKVDAGTVSTGPELWTEMMTHVNRGKENVVGMDRTQVRYFRKLFVLDAQR